MQGEFGRIFQVLKKYLKKKNKEIRTVSYKNSDDFFTKEPSLQNSGKLQKSKCYLQTYYV